MQNSNTLPKKSLTKKSPTIREVARLIGMMISCFPRVEYGELSYRQLEIEKAAALKASNWVFENTMQCNPLCIRGNPPY